ncbi:Alkylated DNA repair protein alkB 8, partial [Blyttiomyces sp. JEL0837]
PWPVVDNFLRSLPSGSIGADVGCGNGKYLGVNKELCMIGSDMSKNLIKICKERGFEAMVCDNLNLPYRSSAFDFVVSIAVIHHFSSFERRVSAVQELVRILRPGGRILIFVWAMEQEGKRKFDAQDVFVPWTLKPQGKPVSADAKEPALVTNLHRYYHMFVERELDTVVEAAGGLTVESSGYDRDNWYIIGTKN